MLRLWLFGIWVVWSSYWLWLAYANSAPWFVCILFGPVFGGLMLYPSFWLSGKWRSPK